MAWFRCIICGENFPSQTVGESRSVGFYVTRFVEAADTEAAEAAALQGLRAEPKLAPPQGYMPTGQARVLFEEIVEVAGGQVPAIQPGIAWHPMEAADAELSPVPNPAA
ncbi:hypothetical protein [Fimbriiglobus ruber]|uniref:Uncharacterized protein n=1 Tax=Fimbriiglobus ruber TaxID=1908690 RepID=A0A225D119_9BACT|nr:hypothetical protein [Fimbriiglobus ruber]OWK35202.1 hypothetical protein FRUB_10044 [Fimbriiglobus ruber]